jgi:hypothetical protein
VFPLGSSYTFQADITLLGNHDYFVWWSFGDSGSDTTKEVKRGDQEQTIHLSQAHTFAGKTADTQAWVYVQEVNTQDEWTDSVHYSVVTMSISSLTNLHAADNTTPDTRTTVGLYEGVTCTCTIDPDLPGAAPQWSVSGGGSVAGYGDPLSEVFTAPGQPANPTVRATLNRTSADREFTVIAPNGMTYLSTSDHVIGDPGADWMGCWTSAVFQTLPVTVTFHGAPFREDIPDFGFSWPNGVAYHQDHSYQPYGVSQENKGPDKWADAYGLKNTPAYLAGIDFGYTVMLKEEYQADSGQWYTFLVNENHDFQYHQAPRQGIARTGSLGVWGGWMGPYAGNPPPP